VPVENTIAADTRAFRRFGASCGLSAVTFIIDHYGVDYRHAVGVGNGPVKYRIYFGRPMSFLGDANDEDEVIARHVERVKDTIQKTLGRGVRQRSGIFFQGPGRPRSEELSLAEFAKGRQGRQPRPPTPDPLVDSSPPDM
jgi:hypothetical protein